ncbi:hypothetical protein TWF696_004251 [Orbilia brochopaga]|uniref:Uncharacterized protein n=1 Tax=Orbilia brochopaga TaxID=3140254 RepID=A0AAV9V5U1_9PEZI
MGKTLVAILACGLYLLHGVDANVLPRTPWPPFGESAPSRGEPKIVETPTGWNRTNIGIDASNPLYNPANLVRGVHNLKHSKRHDFPAPHNEIIVERYFPTPYKEKLWAFYAGDGNIAPELVYGWVTTNGSTCRPFFYSCDGTTYLESCNFTPKQAKVERRRLWELANILMGSQLSENAVDGATFRDPDVQYDTTDLDKYAQMKVSGLDWYAPNLIGYIVNTGTPDYGVAWYYNSPLARNERYMNHFKFKCEDPPADEWVDVP